MPESKQRGAIFWGVVMAVVLATTYAVIFFAPKPKPSIEDATYAKSTLAESGPYALAVVPTPYVSGEDAKQVEEAVQKLFADSEIELVSAQKAVDAGGSVITVKLDGSPIDQGRSTFGVLIEVNSYVYRRGESGQFYHQGASIKSDGRHGHAANEYVGEAMAATAVDLCKGVIEQYKADNP